MILNNSKKKKIDKWKENWIQYLANRWFGIIRKTGLTNDKIIFDKWANGRMKKKYSVPSDGNYAFLWWKLGGAKPSWAKNENYFGKCQLYKNILKIALENIYYPEKKKTKRNCFEAWKWFWRGNNFAKWEIALIWGNRSKREKIKEKQFFYPNCFQF